MIVDYIPEGEEPQRFEFRPGRMRLAACAQIEFQYKKLAGEPKTYQQFVEDIKTGSAVARRVLIHHLLRRQHPAIRIDDVDPYEDEIVLTFHKAELQELRALVEKASNVPDKETVLARLDDEIAAAPDAEEPGKATGETTSEHPSETETPADS